MNNHSIISDEEALQILKNDLRRKVSQDRAPELKDATPERKTEIMAEIDRHVEEQLRSRPPWADRSTLLR